ncbi:hypothetical protein ETAA8_57000 [Anatilimnocola aggregata]|uniref:Uncharacterized protein n=1 Tax=Anatilimnocola aggregata TaxID=2528021 RepID=A0A517YK06_9BACT|nr:hypothetical protein ETAA8_57000 [Anatilimnocola aggregata]
MDRGPLVFSRGYCSSQWSMRERATRFTQTNQFRLRATATTANRGWGTANWLAAASLAAALLAALRSAALRSFAATSLAAALLAALRSAAARSNFATASRSSSGTGRSSSFASRGGGGTGRGGSGAARSSGGATHVAAIAASRLAATAMTALLHFVAAGRLAASWSSFAAAATEEIERRSARRDTEQRNSNASTNDTALHGKLLKTKKHRETETETTGTTWSPEPPAPRALEQCGRP